MPITLTASAEFWGPFDWTVALGWMVRVPLEPNSMVFMPAPHRPEPALVLALFCTRELGWMVMLALLPSEIALVSVVLSVACDCTVTEAPEAVLGPLPTRV